MSPGHHFPCPVTTLVTRRVRPGKEREYETWLKGITKVARTFEGHRGVAILGPHGQPASYSAMVTFDSVEHLRRWMRSQERRRWLDDAEQLTMDDAEVESLTGIEPWFVLPDRSVNQAPPRWKMALLTIAAVYPVLLALSAVLGPLVAPLPAPLGLLVKLLVGIPLMTWVVMPNLTRLVFAWLYPEPPGRRLRGEESAATATADASAR